MAQSPEAHCHCVEDDDGDCGGSGVPLLTLMQVGFIGVSSGL